MMAGKKKRLVKVISWRILSIGITLALTLLWTGDIGAASSFTLILHAFLLISHWCFEAYWEKCID